MSEIPSDIRSRPNRIGSNSAIDLKVLTLNCWGLPQPYPIGSKDRNFRMRAIADDLKTKGKYDVVALEEIWSESDFKIIQELVVESLPYSFYFHSGFLGSGVCVFSKAPIVDTLMHRYSLNGFPHHIHRGDWFGGKIVGLVRIALAQDLILNVYATHIHAEYNREDDLYLPHRVVQAYELSQFVNATAGGGQISIVLGDLNLEPEDLGLRLILANTGLKDAWAARKDPFLPEGVPSTGNTSDLASNSYTAPFYARTRPEGKRIDYVLFGSSGNSVANVRRCFQTLAKIPGSNIDE